MNTMFSFGKIILILLAVLFAAGGFGLKYLQKANHLNAWRLANQGKSSLATIINKRTESGHLSSKDAFENKSAILRYILEYSFKLVDSEKEWRGNDQVTEEEFNSVEIGDQFDVRYWPENPEIATILEDPFEAGAKLAKNISNVFLGVAVLLLVIFIFRFKN